MERISLIAIVKSKSRNIVQEFDRGLIENRDNNLCLYLNPMTYLYYRSKPSCLSSVDMLRFDGLFITKFVNTVVRERVLPQSFDMSSLAPLFFRKSIECNRSVYIAGGREVEVIYFKALIEERYPGVRIVGFDDGYRKDDYYLAKVRDLNPDLVLLSMGSIRQDVLALKLKANYECIIFTSGAFFSQVYTSRGLKYYPAWLLAFNARWLYRFWKEPHVITRVVKYYPIFMFVFLYDLLIFKVTSYFNGKSEI